VARYRAPVPLHLPVLGTPLWVSGPGAGDMVESILVAAGLQTGAEDLRISWPRPSTVQRLRSTRPRRVSRSTTRVSPLGMSTACTASSLIRIYL